LDSRIDVPGARSTQRVPAHHTGREGAEVRETQGRV
jgi:hypothetical protein